MLITTNFARSQLQRSERVPMLANNPARDGHRAGSGANPESGCIFGFAAGSGFWPVPGAEMLRFSITWHDREM